MVRKRQRSGKQAPPGQETANGSIVFIASIATHIGTTVQHLLLHSIEISCARSCQASGHGACRVRHPSQLFVTGLYDDGYDAGQKQQPQLVAQFEKETMFGRIGYPDELKGAMLFLCSQASGWYTGQDLLVDGGASSWKHPASF
jgi:NAD(P)-dependent dehydrogenase (short-subunit alcohol dehydrogenase family)